MPQAAILRRAACFALIGAAATAVYAAVAVALSASLGGGAVSAVLASLTAYAFAALFSYMGHKYITFASNGAHAFEAPRFALLTVLGICLSWLVPTLMVGLLSFPPAVSVAAICVLIPVINLVLLDRWVFSAAMPPQTGEGTG